MSGDNWNSAHADASPECDARRIERRKRAWKLAYVVAMLAVAAGAALCTTLGTGYAKDCSVINIELQPQRQAWYEQLQSCWTDSTAGAGEVSSHLQWQLGADTYALVPGYTAALLLLIVALSGAVRYPAWMRHLLCVAPVAAGLLDWLENGLIFQAAIDAQHQRLAQDLVGNLAQVSWCKWNALAFCWAILAFLVFLDRTQVILQWRARSLQARPILADAAAASCATTAIALWAGLFVWLPMLTAAMLMFVVSLCLVPAWLYRREQLDSNPGNRGQGQLAQV